MRRKSEAGLRNSIDFANEVFVDHDAESGLCSKLYFHKNTSKRRFIDFIHLLNLLYIAVSIPLLISFDIRMEWYLILGEIFSLFLSLLFIIINIRTPVHLRGGTTLSLKVVIQYYYHNGLLLDLVALWPLNLLFGVLDIVQPIWLIPFLRLIRLISIWRIMLIFGRFELYFKKYSLLMHILKAALFL